MPDPAPPDDWRKDMGRCVLNDLGECLAKIPQACLCALMPRAVYEERRRKLFPVPSANQE